MAARAVLLGDRTTALQHRVAGARRDRCGPQQQARADEQEQRNGVHECRTGRLGGGDGTRRQRNGVNSYVWTLCVEWRSRMRELRLCSGASLALTSSTIASRRMWPDSLSHRSGQKVADDPAAGLGIALTAFDWSSSVLSIPREVATKSPFSP